MKLLKKALNVYEHFFKKDPDPEKYKSTIETSDEIFASSVFEEIKDREVFQLPDSFDFNKPTILLIDDSAGMISFLKDDMREFHEENSINLDEVNVLSLSGAHAAFDLQDVIQEHTIEKLDIKWAIIDITLGGSIMTSRGNIKYTGVDVYDMIKRNDLKFIFYTGNKLNKYIKSNSKLINQFTRVSGGKDIFKYVFFKSSMDIDSRRMCMKERLFSESGSPQSL